LLPFIFASIAIDIFWQTPIASIWMISRVLVTTLMWRFGGSALGSDSFGVRLPWGQTPLGSDSSGWGWHGKWSVLWGALFVMGLGFVCILSASSLPLLIFGLVAFGAGMGVTYYVALYYAMSVGRAEVNAGGKHEAFIGGGYMAGPLIGLVSLQGVTTTFTPIIYAVLSILVLATAALWVIWKKAR
jgi:hypothetical protein